MISAFQGGSVIEAWMPEKDYEESGLNCLEMKEKMDDHSNKFFRIWNRNGILYDVICSQFLPFGCNLVCWYQGESDTTLSEGRIYDKELEVLVNAWRRDMRDETTPFIIVRTADLDDRNDDAWKSVQQAQERAVMNIPNTYLVDAASCCETNTIHPTHKKKLAIHIGKKILEILETNK